MPTYNMKCQSCDLEYQVTQSIHDELETWHQIHPDQYHTCGPAVQVFSPPTIFGVGPSGRAAAMKDASAKARERDVEAYRRLRKNGVQPPQVSDSAEIEARANETIEVERNTAFEHKGLRRRMQAASDEAAATQQVA